MILEVGDVLFLKKKAYLYLGDTILIEPDLCALVMRPIDLSEKEKEAIMHGALESYKLKGSRVVFGYRNVTRYLLGRLNSNATTKAIFNLCISSLQFKAYDYKKEEVCFHSG